MTGPTSPIETFASDAPSSERNLDPADVERGRLAEKPGQIRFRGLRDVFWRTVSEFSEDRVTLIAAELVNISVGPVGAASESVAQVRTGADGGVKKTLQLPDWIPRGKQAIVTITDLRQTVLARSPRFTPN